LGVNALSVYIRTVDSIQSGRILNGWLYPGLIDDDDDDNNVYTNVSM